MIQKWKTSFVYWNIPRINRLTKLGYRGRRVLSREIWKNCVQLMTHLHQEFQQASGWVMMNTICKEDHMLSLHGCAIIDKPQNVAYKPCNHAVQLRWCKAHQQWTVQQRKGIFLCDESRFIFYCSDDRILVRCLLRECLLQECIVPTVKFGMENYDIGIFFHIWLGTLGSKT